MDKIARRIIKSITYGTDCNLANYEDNRQLNLSSLIFKGNRKNLAFTKRLFVKAAKTRC